MVTPIVLPIETPGATNAKQQVDGVTAAVEKLDQKSRAYTQTSGQATDATNRNAEAFKRRADALRSAEAATVKGAVADALATSKLKEQTSATNEATKATKAHEAAMNKLGEAISKGSPVAGQAVKALGTTVGAVGLAATAVKMVVTTAWTELVNHVVEESERGGKAMRALAEAQKIIGDATSTRNKEAAGTQAQQADALNTLTSVGGDRAVTEAQKFIKETGQDPAAVYSSMAKMRNAGMSQEQTMRAMGAAHEGSVLGYGSFSDMAGKAAGMPGASFTGNLDRDVSSVVQSDQKADPKAQLEQDNMRKARLRAQSNAMNEGAMERYVRAEEKWQMARNNTLGMFGGDTAAYEAANPRPVRPSGNAKAFDYESSNAGGPGVGSLDDITSRRRNRAGSQIAGGIDRAAIATANTALLKSQNAIENGAAGAEEEERSSRSAIQTPGMAAAYEKQRQLMLERDAAFSKTTALENSPFADLMPYDRKEARGDERRANEALDRFTEALDKVIGKLNGGNGEPAKVVIVGGIPTVQTANGE